MKDQRIALSSEAKEKWFSVDYRRLLLDAGTLAPGRPKEGFFEELRNKWRNVYEDMTPHPMNLCLISLGTFEYMYDAYDLLEQLGSVPINKDYESRLVGVVGYSKPQMLVRDDGRLKGWVGPTEKLFGRRWDKGHFVAHSVGGAVDQWELNVFAQRRDLNRGWSKEGKTYRCMENHCFENADTLFFSRPVYSDGSSTPVMLEFGLLKPNGEWWIERFEN